jgi:putative endonuclease
MPLLSPLLKGFKVKNYTYYFYIIANATRCLYSGMTNNLHARVWKHKNKTFEGYTNHFRVCRLVYWESFDDVLKAIDREKQINRWRREKKIKLIESVNPNWHDLSDGWYETDTKDKGIAPRLAKKARSGWHFLF